LDGEVDRGAVSRLRAVIYFADLRGFSALAEQLPGEEVVAMLDDYLDCLARPVVDRGGEVLKFLGDGVLCVFEIGPDEPHFACYVGLGAAREALRRIDALNAERRARGAPVMQAGIALHLGDVLYGNVGIEGRLDFTVIGPAVNEAARLEAECRELDRPLLVSEDFHAAADHCRDALVSLGRRQLRGITRRQEVYTLMPELFEEADAD
ncbi:MAG TPA: adenylate/guanylate cyclase domain-containing protein, partial [Alphaproteobacteria bacterium]|nr:adenylate/guanylate cyclase domain-containing protein [Alphaproteobacteria bacterium]